MHTLLQPAIQAIYTASTHSILVIGQHDIYTTCTPLHTGYIHCKPRQHSGNRQTWYLHYLHTTAYRQYTLDTCYIYTAGTHSILVIGKHGIYTTYTPLHTHAIYTARTPLHISTMYTDHCIMLDMWHATTACMLFTPCSYHCLHST